MPIIFSQDSITLLLYSRNPSHGLEGAKLANQYSITVSDGSDMILKKCKEYGCKPSQVIDAVIYFIGIEGCINLNRMKKRLGDLEVEE